MLEMDPGAPETGWLDRASRRFDAVNDGLVEPTRRLLDRVTGDAAAHPRLLNTLSLLEHMGSHKIMTTQYSAAVDLATLKHVAEEAHHAYFMKRQAEKAAGRPLEYVDETLLAPAAARMYFQRLEATTVRALEGRPSPRAAYLCMSLIVEFRALWFYGLFQEALKRAAHAMSLKRLIGEERSHLADMADRLAREGALSDSRVDRLVDREHALYTRLLAAFRDSDLNSENGVRGQ